MKKLLIITLLAWMLLPAWALAGTEVLDPDGLVRIEADWDSFGCDNQDIWPCIADDVDANQVLMFDNNTVGAVVLLSVGNPSTTDSTIDSVNVMLRVQVSAITTTKPALVDSVAGQTAGLRASASITLSANDVWEEHIISYALNPDGNSWSWTDLANYYVGVEADLMGNNRTSQCTKIEVTIYYTYAAAGGGVDTRRRRNLAGGNQ
jgi:hypothetical protein